MGLPFVLSVSLLMFLLGQTVQALSITFLISVLSRQLRARGRSPKDITVFGRFLILATTLFFLLGNCILQISLWAIAFMQLGQFVDYQEAFYHSAVNFTTLGYGDIVMEHPWRILGAMEAISGILMLGLSTATLSNIFGRLLRLRRQPEGLL